MTTRPKILAFAGSTRKESVNKKLIAVAAQAATDAGAEVTTIDLRDFPLPVYDGDLEEESGIPENAKKLKEIFHKHRGLLISSPEYNSSLSAVIKNTIDWISRPMEGEPPMAAFNDKVAALMAASPGTLGGLRGLTHLRAILSSINVLVIPQQVALPGAFQAFDEEGGLKDENTLSRVRNVTGALVGVVGKLGG